MWLGEVRSTTCAVSDPLKGPTPPVMVKALSPCHATLSAPGMLFLRTFASCSAFQTAWGDAANLCVPFSSMCLFYPFFSRELDRRPHSCRSRRSRQAPLGAGRRTLYGHRHRTASDPLPPGFAG